jgi:hypothetical protein
MNHSESRDTNEPQAIMPLSWWLVAIVTVGAILMVAGGLIALFRQQMLLTPHQEITQAVRVYAGYVVSRNLALGLLLLTALSLRARGPLSTLMVLYAGIQFLDAILDCVEGRWAIAPGIVVLGLLFLMGAARVSGHALWSAKGWQQAS